MITSTIDSASNVLQSAQTGLDTARTAAVTTKRVVSGTAGAALLFAGLRRRGLTGALAAVAGADLIYHGVRGKGHLFDGLRRSRNGGGEELPYGRGVLIKESVIVARPAGELYAVWRDFENLPVFMEHVESVQVADETHSHWVVKGPLGKPIEWDAEVIADRESEIIGWRTKGDQTLAHAGSVRFESLDKQSDVTRVIVTFQFNPPAGLPGATVARFLGADPEAQVRNDLGRFKQFSESMDLNMLKDLLDRKQLRDRIGASK